MLKQNYQKVILYKSQTFLFCDNYKFLWYTEENKSIYIWKKKKNMVVCYLSFTTKHCCVIFWIQSKEIKTLFLLYESDTPWPWPKPVKAASRAGMELKIKIVNVYFVIFVQCDWIVKYIEEEHKLPICAN